MHRRLLFTFACFLFTGAATTRAQSLPSAQPAPAPTSADTPAQDSASDQSSSSKKVWTNDDFSAASPHPAGSIVSRQPKAVAPGRTSAAGRNAKWYHDRIAALQAKLPPLDTQISALQSAIDGKPAGDTKKSTRPYYGVKVDDWSRELAQLQQKRSDTLAQIASLQDQARHAGVPASALP